MGKADDQCARCGLLMPGAFLTTIRPYALVFILFALVTLAIHYLL